MNKKIIITFLLALTAGLGGGYFIARVGPGGVPAGETETAERKPVFYRNPMNPEITSAVPAKDEMGMDYIPVYADGGSGANAPTGSVSIDPVTAQNIGVRSVVAIKKSLTRDVRTVGRLDYDEKRVTRLHPKVEGWIDELFIDVTGAKVGRGTMLLSLYAPQLVASEEEYLLALKNAELLQKSSQKDIRDGARRLADAALERLELLDVPEHQLEAIRREKKIFKNLHIHSPFDGIVIAIGVREGQFVTPKTELYTIADLSRIWVYVDIYEDEMPWVRAGDAAEMNVTGVPGRVFMGTVTYIYPYLDAKTRTNKVRLEFDNPDQLLKPEMFAHVTLKTSRQVDAVVVPSEAIVRTGAQEQVFVVRGEGKFEPRRVRLGVTTGGTVQIVDGISEGERVVTSAQFLIDSESKLNEATAKMLELSDTKAPKPDSRMDMDGMDMGQMKMKTPDDMSMEGMRLEEGE
ncbi:MAG: efflux RND transporter periplasmic adaptor subunit [Nitrospinota bacterium]|nr:efflux RND transporter periplasmic adaptor subunit [Nitrospinota bacterium]